MDGPRGCRPAELSAAVELANDIFRPADRTMQMQYPTMFKAENSEWLRTIWDGERPVSLVGVWRGEISTFGRRLRVAHMGAVGTQPEYRNRGLAGSIVADAMRRLADDGVALLLISGHRTLYTRAGARPFGRLHRVRLDLAAFPTSASEGAGALTTERLAEVGPELLATFAELQAREPARYLRSREDWRALLPAKGYVPPARGRGAVVARRRGTVAAYALYVTGSGWRGPEGAERERLRVDEFGGERAAVWAAVRHAGESVGAATAEFLVQPFDGEMLAIARSSGAVIADARHQGLARVLDADAILAAVADGSPADADGLMRLRPSAPLGTDAEAEEAARFLEALVESSEAPPLWLPRNDGLNYI